ncbi:TPM domain-containing protein [Paenibacillus sp. S150]|uniref:TPM domain-containing protein n=1 Tax=Paenibacillus sp. S150 TaxID=2749826 RepID=UPI001C55AC59|nr:TPM domain-containing protein [Paenibacillus sp. S150]MBW4080726.1 TPM domain-containing protein [Paenibacillus sp. S150]
MKHTTFRTALIAMLLSVWLLPSFSSAQTAVPDHTASFYVNDFANVIDAKTENYMVNYGVRLHQKDGAQVVLVTVDSTNGISMEEYATSLFNSWGVGSADKNNGVLVLLSIKDDDYWAVPGKGLESALNGNKLSQILSESLEPDFARKDYSAGARKTYGALVQSLGGIYSETIGSRIYVGDNAGVFKQVTKDYLNQSGNRYQPTANSGVYVVTVKNSGDKSLEDYTYAKFASMGAGPNDVLLVLDTGGDNYHVLQGKGIDGILTNDAVKDILNRELEPLFAQKDYAAGATAAANAFYSFFLARADHVQEAAANSGTPAVAAGQPVKGSASPVTVKEVTPVSMSKGLTILTIFLFIILLISWAASRRNRHIALYGMPVNPYSARNIRRYGTWYGQPGYGSGSRWYNRRHRQRRSPAPQRHSGSSFWGGGSGGGSTNHGGGGSSGGGGAGRSSSHRETNHGGGSSSGGGAGTHSSGSSGGSNHGGGGNAGGGGGVGRHR